MLVCVMRDGVGLGVCKSFFFCFFFFFFAGVDAWWMCGSPLPNMFHLLPCYLNYTFICLSSVPGRGGITNMAKVF